MSDELRAAINYLHYFLCGCDAVGTDPNREDWDPGVAAMSHRALDALTTATAVRPAERVIEIVREWRKGIHRGSVVGWAYDLAVAIDALDADADARGESPSCPIPGCVSTQPEHERARESWRIQRLRGALMEYADPANYEDTGSEDAPWEIAAEALAAYDGKPWVPPKRQKADARGETSGLPLGRDPSARATLARMPVINDPVVTEAMAALEDADARGESPPGAAGENE